MSTGIFILTPNKLNCKFPYQTYLKIKEDVESPKKKEESIQLKKKKGSSQAYLKRHFTLILWGVTSLPYIEYEIKLF